MPARWTATTTTTLGDAGAALVQSAMAAVSVTLSPGNTFMHPYGRFALDVVFSATGSISPGVTFDLYFQYGDGTKWEPTPSISNRNTYVGSFKPAAATQAISAQHMVIEQVPLPLSFAKVFLFNGTAAGISASWALVMVPFSLTAT